ncbi:unnamed protein product [Gulo gulo]|uniref:Uncharacterized protein n=1 Tax=Gulo gulo TaxID=48420 RepID=A0A9X9PVL2_GULGU|nr:unnamed protein product [Gulo gulo]
MAQTMCLQKVIRVGSRTHCRLQQIPLPESEGTTGQAVPKQPGQGSRKTPEAQE